MYAHILYCGFNQSLHHKVFHYAVICRDQGYQKMT